MKIHKFKALLITVFIAASTVAAQDKAAQIDQLLKKYNEYNQFHGSVLVADNGGVIYKKGFGLANVEWNIANRPDTKFRIGSVTKQFTAALILQLVEEGKLKLDGKLTDYLPDYRKDTGDKVTIHQLLNHTSGIPSYTNPAWFQNDSRDPYKVDDFVEKFASGDLEFEPGSKFRYNNSAYFILGAIIEKVTGKTYAAVLKARILDPVGMKDSGYDVSSEIIERRAAGYEITPDGHVNADYLDMSLPYAGGSMYSTVEDLFKWDQALYGDKILSVRSKELMFTPGLENFGYGFIIDERPIGTTEKKTKVIHHDGGINGFNSLFTRFPERKAVVILLDNVSLGRYHDSITNAIYAILNGVRHSMPKRSIAEAIYKTATQQGGAAAVSEYRSLKASKPDDYNFAEAELNGLGYQLLRAGKVKDSIEIFKLNVEMYPKAFNPYDSLGEAYLKDGQRDLALANYKRSVELNPENAGGVWAINQIEGKVVKVDPAALQKLIGEYRLAPNFVLTITVEGGQLFGQATGQGKIKLDAVSETQFTAASVGATVTFEKDASGSIISLTLLQGGRTIPAKRIK